MAFSRIPHGAVSHVTAGLHRVAVACGITVAMASRSGVDEGWEAPR